MKIITALILISALPSMLEAKRKSDLQHEGLIGRVRTVCEYRFYESQEPPDYKDRGLRKEQPYVTVSYNEQGDRAEETHRYGPPMIVYRYDAEGNRMVDQWLDGLFTNSVEPKPPVPGRPYREEYRYDALGRRIERLIREVPYRWRSVYSYDNGGRLKEEHLYSLKEGGPLIRKIFYSYGADKALEREAWYGATGLLEDEITYSGYKYDSRGNWIIRKAVRHQRYDKNQPAHQMWWAYREIVYY